MLSNVPITIVAAMGKNTRVIGKDNSLIWHVPADMKRFKALTVGKPIIMGRKTFESIIALLGKPLPARTNIVVTRNTDYCREGVYVVTSLEEAFEKALAENPSEIHIGGGAELYRQALPLVDTLYLTYFFDDAPGDSTFPPFEEEFEIITSHPIQSNDGLFFQWVDYTRIQQ